MPIRSSGRPHDAPLIDRPSDRLASMSVKALISVRPSFQLKRREQAEIVADLLLQVEIEAVLGAALARLRDGVVGG